MACDDGRPNVAAVCRITKRSLEEEMNVINGMLETRRHLRRPQFWKRDITAACMHPKVRKDKDVVNRPMLLSEQEMSFELLNQSEPFRSLGDRPVIREKIRRQRSDWSHQT